MPTTYHHAEAHIEALVTQLMQQWRPQLAENDVKVGVLFAMNTETEPLKKGGYPAMSIVQNVPLLQRMYTDVDAIIRIDDHAFNALSERSQEAVLAHDLMHLELVLADGEPKRDDLGRPLLKIRSGDWNGGDGFGAISAYYGDASMERRNALGVKAALAKAEREADEAGSQLTSTYTTSSAGGGLFNTHDDQNLPD